MSRRLEMPAHRPTAPEAAVALSIAAFLSRTERERRRLFGEYLRASVTRVSPLLLDLADSNGIDLAAVAAMMQPPRDWPWRPRLAPADPAISRQRAVRLLFGMDVRRRSREFRRAFAGPGVVVRGIDDPLGHFAVRPKADSLDFAVGIGPCALSSVGDIAMLQLPEPLPETITLSMPGRRLGHIIDHPILRDRDIRISDVISDPAKGLPILVFRVRPVPYSIFGLTFSADLAVTIA